MGAAISAQTLLLAIVWILLCRSSTGQHCGHPGKPAFTEFDPSDIYKVGHRVNYKCIDGYLLNSPFRNVTEFAEFGERECLPDGTWSYDNVYCYKLLPVQASRCTLNTDRYQCSSLTSDTLSDLLLITSLYQGNIFGLNVGSCGTRFGVAKWFSTCTALFRFPLDKNSSGCRPFLNQQVSVGTLAWDEISVTPYARHNLCGTPETPANGKLIRVNDTTVQHVCNTGYQLEGNEYRYCIDSLWYGTQVVCNKTAEQNENDQSISFPYHTFYAILMVVLAFAALVGSIALVMFFVIKWILKQRDHSNTDTGACTMKNAKTVYILVDSAPVCYETQDNMDGASDPLHEVPVHCSALLARESEK